MANKNAAGKTVPAWLVHSRTIDRRLFLWLLLLLSWAGRRSYVVASVKELAQWLGLKSSTATRLANQTEELVGLFVRRRINRQTVWFLSQKTYQSGQPDKRFSPDEIIPLVRAHIQKCEQYVNDKRVAKDRLLDAKFRVESLKQGERQHLDDIINLKKKHAVEIERLHKIQNELSQLDQRSAPKEDYYWNLVGRETNLQMSVDQDRAYLSEGALYWAKQEKDESFKYNQEMQSREYREDFLKLPAELVKDNLPRGKYTTIPKGLLTKGFKQQHKLKDLSGPVRLALLIRCEAKGKLEYFTKIKQLAAGLDVSDDSIGRWMKTLCAAGITGLEYAFGFSKAEKMTYKMKNGSLWLRD